MAHYNLGKVYQKQRKWDKAIDAFEGAAKLSPNNANFQYDLGEAYLEAKHLDKAETALKKATELDPKLFKAQWRLGLVYVFEERPKEADLALRNAIELNPRMDKPFIALGRLYLDYDADKEAAQVLAECVRANENSAECYNLHGVALKALKQYEQAVSEFKKALDSDSGLFDALYNCGMTYAEWYEESHASDQKQQARDYLQKFVATGGGKDGSAFGFLRAASDKLYALSGP
jgi:tetratricopeptide (TPR) repeat protein